MQVISVKMIGCLIFMWLLTVLHWNTVSQQDPKNQRHLLLCCEFAYFLKLLIVLTINQQPYRDVGRQSLKVLGTELSPKISQRFLSTATIPFSVEVQVQLFFHTLSSLVLNCSSLIFRTRWQLRTPRLVSHAGDRCSCLSSWWSSVSLLRGGRTGQCTSIGTVSR